MISGRPLLAFSPSAIGVLALLLLDPSFSEIKNFAPTIIFAFVIIWGVIRLAPTWKEVKMREMDIREKEVVQREHQAMATQALAETTRDIAIETKYSIEALRIAERVTIREGEKLSETTREIKEAVQTVAGRVDAMEKTATA